MTLFGIPLLPTTPKILNYLSAPVGTLDSSWANIPLLIIYFAGELVLQERDANLGDLMDVAPVPEWVFFTGKFLGIGLVIVAWMALLMATGSGMQLILGFQQLSQACIFRSFLLYS